jgi:proline iminopeptidase
MEIHEGYISFQGYRTYYRIVGAEYRKTPLLILHGGPGSTHNSYELLDDFAEKDERPIVMYDQLGCGLSALEDPHPALWKASTWVDELINLRSELHLSEIHLLGHSWGGMLSIIYLTDYAPKGVRSVVLSSTLSSARLWSQETHRLLRFLPEEEQEAIARAEKEKDFSSLEFLSANQHYLSLYVGDKPKDTDPDCLRRPKVFGKESYELAWGPCEFTPLGTLRDYEYTEKMKNIRLPVLFTSGANDESTPLQNKTMMEQIPGEKRWVLFAKSRHMSYYEEHDLYEEELKRFLDAHD